MKLLISFYMIYVVTIVAGGSSCSSVFKPLDKHYDSHDTAIGAFIFENLATCASACLRVTSCVFVNYYSLMKFCIFYTSQHDGGWSVPVDMEDWKRVMKADPCSNKPCSPGQRCIPNRSSYICEDYECLCCNSPYLAYHHSYNVSSMDSSSPENGLSLTDLGPSWLPDLSDQDPYIVVSFIDRPFLVKGIATRGDQYRHCWTSRYTVEASMDCKTFTLLENSGGNDDVETTVITYIQPPIIPKCLKLNIVAFENYPCLKMDVIGCYDV